MPVNPDDATHDMFWPVRFTPYDERVEVDGWVFYVRAVKFRRDLYGGGLTANHPMDAAFIWAMDMALSRWPWQVGIVRIGGIATWNDRKPLVVHHEKLPPRVEPGERIAMLAEQVRAGAFLSD